MSNIIVCLSSERFFNMPVWFLNAGTGNRNDEWETRKKRKKERIIPVKEETQMVFVIELRVCY